MNRLVALVLIFSFGFTSCKKDDETTSDNNSYDRTEMLTHFNDSLIIPVYQATFLTADQLTADITEFTLNPSLSGLTNARLNFEQLYTAWQTIAHLELGPAEAISLRGNVNVYPTDTIQIHANITSGAYDLGTADNTDAKGLPAISYLLYGTGNTDNDMVSYYANNPDAGTYLKAITTDCVTKISGVYNTWQEAYGTEFKSRKGTDAGSSTSLLYNALVSHTERYFRDGKLGIPAGKRTLGETLPEKTENYYSGRSIPLAVTNLKAIYRFFSATEKVSFYHYLKALDAKYNGQLLADVVDAQFKTAIDKLEAIPDPLSTTVNTDMPVIDAAYIEIQKLIVLLKTDVPSALGVLINYQDNDGD